MREFVRIAIFDLIFPQSNQALGSDGVPGSGMRPVRRIAAMTIVLAAAGGLAGAACALVMLSPMAVQQWLWPTGDDVFISFGQLAPFAAAVGAGVGVVVGPVLAWGLLRSVPLWRALFEPTAGAAVGSFAVWGFCMLVPITPVPLVVGLGLLIGGGIVGAVAAGMLLRHRVIGRRAGAT